MIFVNVVETQATLRPTRNIICSVTAITAPAGASTASSPQAGARAMLASVVCHERTTNPLIWQAAAS